MSGDALARLRARKAAQAGTDVAAADDSAQWDRLLGEGASKKPRCAICTRPLSEREQSHKLTSCLACEPIGIARILAHEEWVFPVVYGYVLRRRPCADARVTPAVASAPAESSRGPAARSAAVPSPSPSPQSPRPELSRGAELAAPAAGVLSAAVPDGSTLLSLVSFNILADCYVRVEGQPWNAFTHCTDAHLAWEHRRPRILELLRATAADVICLQEVMAERRAPPGGGSAEWCLPAWTDELCGYTGVLQGLKQQEWTKNAERNLRVCGREVPTGVATFFKTSRWEEAAPSKHGSGSGTVVFLRCRDAPGDGAAALEVAVGNIHLVGDPEKFEAHVKALSSLRKNMGNKFPLRVICGDFNGEIGPESEVSKWVAQEGLIEAPTGSSWAAPGDAQRLDHVLHAPSLRVLAASGPLAPEEVASGLPCASCPSDHAPVAALFACTPPREKGRADVGSWR